MEGDVEFLNKVEANEAIFYLFIHKNGVELAEGFHLKVTDGCEMWSKNVGEDFLQDMASKFEMNLKEYSSQTWLALTGQDLSNDYVYQAVKNDTELNFSWKKVLDDGVKYQLGSISLQSKDKNKELMQEIMNFSISKMDTFKDKIKSMKTEIEQLSNDYSNAILRLEKCVASKEEMELDLFEKFVAVLNDKKAKIRRLQDVNEQLQAKADSVKVSGSLIQNETKITKRTDDTDDESNAPLEKESEKQSVSSNMDTTLFKDEEDTAPVVKRRRKKQNKTINVTPSKPILPEVKAPVKRTISNASTDSTAPTDSKQSSAKVTRKSSRTKNATPTFPDDMDELFGDMA